MTTATCKLCLNLSILQDSHIIPASMHRTLKDQSGKNIGFRLPGDLILKNQKDLKEYMLCKDCEQLFSVLEKRTIELLRPLWKSSQEGRRHSVLPRNSTSFVLQFVHSIFWRASVANLLPQYRLNQEDEEILRESLLNNSPVPPPRLAVRLDFFTALRDVGSANMVQSPGMHSAFSDASYSAFVALGIIFSMQSPYESQLFDLGPYVTPGRDYKIVAAPTIIAAPCNAVLEEVRQLAVQHQKKSG